MIPLGGPLTTTKRQHDIHVPPSQLYRSHSSRSTIVLKAFLRTFAQGAEVWAHGSWRPTGSKGAGAVDVFLRNPASLEAPQSGIDDLRRAIAKSSLAERVNVYDWASLTDAMRREISSRHVVLVPPDPALYAGQGMPDV